MKKLSRIIGAILFLLGALLLFFSRSFVIPAFSRPIDIIEEGMESVVPNKAVEAELDVIFERFARMDNRDYYVIPVWSNDQDYVVPIAVAAGTSGDYAKVVEETMDYMYGYSYDFGTKSAHFEGVALKLDDKVSEKMKNWFRETGFFEQESDMDVYMLPYMLYQVNLDGVKQNTITFSAMIIIGFALLCIGTFAHTKVNVSLELKETKINGVTYRMEQLKTLNDLIMKGDKKEALNILMREFNVESGYAAFVADNWSEYYY